MSANQLRSDLLQFIKFVENQSTDQRGAEEVTSDQIWVDNWTSNRFHRHDVRSNVDTRKKIKLTFNEFKSELTSISDSFQEFKPIEKDLNENIHTYNEQKWSSIIDKFKEQKPILLPKLISIKNKIPLIRRKIKENKRKRSKKCYKNVNHLKFFGQSIEINERLIEEWIQKNEMSDQKSENESQLKKEANIVMNDTKRRINDIKRGFKKINLLHKYRHLLRTKARQSSEAINCETDDTDHTFADQINKIKDLLKRRLKTYRKEENTIDKMLTIECSHQLDGQKELTVDELNRTQLAITQALFGTQVFPEPNTSESMNTWQTLEASQQSFDKMLRTRYSWDRYLDMSRGTPIPSHYVMPNSRPNTDWNKYLKDYDH